MLKFSIVTTCRNEINSVERWRADILSQTRQPDEIVIVDAFSDDGTSQVLREWAGFDPRLVFHQEAGAAAHGRNVAIEKAKYEHILSTDMGVRLCPIWCEELIKPFEEDSSVQVVAGGTQIDRETVDGIWALADYYTANCGEPECIIGNRSLAYTKKVWRELGGLPEDLTFYADDSVFKRQILQANYKVVQATKAMTYWARPKTLKAFCKELYNYGYGDGEASIKTPFAFRLYERGRLPKWSVPLLTGLRIMQKQFSLKYVKKAVRDRNFTVLPVMPIFLFCRGFNFGKGYLAGDENGKVNCLECRQRLMSRVSTS